jgi:two-component system, NarL family, nitrate/nitrite response regulator NarL
MDPRVHSPARPHSVELGPTFPGRNTWALRGSLDVNPEDVPMELLQHSPISVFVVSDVRFYREGLGNVLSSNEIVVLGTSATDESLQLVAQFKPDVILLDTAMIDGVWVAEQLAAAVPGTRIIALDVPPAEEELNVLFEAGVLGYVTREQSLDEVAAAIRSVVREEMVCPSSVRSLVVKRLQALAAEFGPRVHTPLTSREREILELIAQGLSNKEIAGELRIERSTVKNHVHNILDKLQVQSRMAAVAEMRLGPRLRSSLHGRAASVSGARFVGKMGWQSVLLFLLEFPV